MGDVRRLPAVVVVMSIVTVSCGAERSVEAFCSAYRDERARLGEKYERQVDVAEDQEPVVGLLLGIGMLAEAQGDMIALFKRLERHAPDEIAPQVGLVRETLERQAEAMASGSLREMLVGAVVPALQANGAAQDVDRYIADEC